MATINNSDVLKHLSDTADIQTAHDDVPNQLAEKIVPVLVANPEHTIKWIESNRVATGVNTMFTTSATKRTFITAAQLCAMCDAANTGTDFKLSAVPLHKSEEKILTLDKVASVAFQDSISINFTKPIEIKKSSAVKVGSTYGAGVGSVSAVVYYYEVEEH